MNNSNKNFLTHFKKSVLWFIGNAAFAAAPFIFLYCINELSEEDVSIKEIHALIETGVLGFVCCAITGAAAVSFIMSGHRVRGRLQVFAIYISPFCMLFYLFLKYLLVYVQYDDQHSFGAGSITMYFLIAFTILYSILVRTIHYIKEDYARHRIDL
jgi:hypothetical protein